MIETFDFVIILDKVFITLHTVRIPAPHTPPQHREVKLDSSDIPSNGCYTMIEQSLVSGWFCALTCHGAITKI